MNKHLIIVFNIGIILLLSACNSMLVNNCDINVVNSNGIPCWVLNTPEQGIVVNMPRHIKPEETRHQLLQKATVELSAMANGLEVSQDSRVDKVVHVINSNVSNQSKVTSLSTVSSAKDSKLVKVKVKALWTDRRTETVYMWAILD